MGVTKVRLAEEKEEKPKEKRVEKRPEVAKKAEARVLVRVAGTDLDGEKPLRSALEKIKGISYAMSKAVCEAGGFDPNSKLGSLSEGEIKKLEAVIREPANFGIPPWVLNRRWDPATGTYVHLTGSDLDVAKKFDIQKEIDLKTYRGTRHMLGQPVRGQRTRSSFRTGRIVGVVKRTVKLAMEKAKEKEKK
jgi:small subunit ribosomal protein S13